METLVFCALLAFLLTGNLAATITALRSDLFPRDKKRLQLVLIWAVPIIGAGTVLYFTVGWQGRHRSDLGSTNGNGGTGGDPSTLLYALHESTLHHR